MLRLQAISKLKPILSVCQLPVTKACARKFATAPQYRRASGHDKRVFRQFSVLSPTRNPSQTAEAEMSQALTPAVLPGTVKDFPIPKDKLIKLAQKVLLEDDLGKNDDSVLAEDFRFEFPIIKLDKQGYLKAVRTFDFKEAFPDFNQNPYDWRVDHFEPQRVWFTVRVTATHTGPLKIFNKYTYKPTGKKVFGAPEALSLTFNPEGKVTSVTGGYVIDNRLGNTNKLGALFGILQGIDVFVPHPQPGTLGWKAGVAVDTAVNLIKTAFNFVTFNIFKGKAKLQ